MQELVNEIKQTKEQLIEAIDAFTDTEFNTVPFEGSWTPAQVSEHILKASSAKVLYGSTTETTRPPDEKIAELKKIFLDFSTKMQSPDFILPSSVPHKKEDMIAGLSEKFDAFTEAVSTLDLNLTCTSFELPRMGFLTRLELVCFFLAHTQRHIHQLQKIKETISN
jgi:hypothetical protein